MSDKKMCKSTLKGHGRSKFPYSRYFYTEIDIDLKDFKENPVAEGKTLIYCNDPKRV